MPVRLLVILLLCGSTYAADPAKPLLVVVEQNPWLAVVGADSPKFALYDDGTVIYRGDRPTPDQPFLIRKVPDALAFEKKLMSFNPAKVASTYQLSEATDQITTTIWTPARSITIYGDWRKPLVLGIDSDPEMRAFSFQEKKRWEELPGEIRQTLLRVEEQRKQTGAGWFPEKIEVMFWPYAYAPKDTIAWPADWPGVDAKDTLKRGEDSFSIYLPAAKLAELRQLLDNRRKQGAVLLAGKKMAQSLRFPFPAEQTWMQHGGQFRQ